MFKPVLIDAHCHVDFLAKSERARLLQLAVEGGVRGAVNAGVWWDAFDGLLKESDLHLAARVNSAIEFDSLFSSEARFQLLPCLGLHPMEIAARWKDERGLFCLEKAKRDVHGLQDCAVRNSEFIWAIGETGFDLSKTVLNGWAEKNELLKAQDFGFEACFELALRLGLPLVVHSRSAWQTTRERLSSASRSGLRSFMIHCYGGPAEDLPWVASLGGLASFGGVMTWPDAKRMKQACRACPEASFLLETDAPDLAPVQTDGSRPELNEPSMLNRIAAVAAELRGVTLDEIILLNYRNLRHFLLA
ncbi:MAG: hypothetical protein RIR26_2167 [Pseudomonadota bacterium]